MQPGNGTDGESADRPGSPSDPRPASADGAGGRSRIGVVSMIFGIAAIPTAVCALLGLVLGAVGIVLGLIGIRRAADGRPVNRRMASTGVICGAVAIILSIVVAVVSSAGQAAVG